jgi:DNA-binding GntR family transcriptional regulator
VVRKAAEINFLSDNPPVPSVRADRPDPDPFAALSVDEPVSTVDRVVEELRRALFEGDIVPGTPLREVALAESLGVSRPTVREALAALVAEGLADRMPNRGTVVRTLSPQDVLDVSNARLALELAGIDRWADASADDRQAVRDAYATYAALDGTDATAVDINAAHLAIHRALTALTGSARLVAMSESLYAEIRLALAQVDRAKRNLREQLHTHGTLLELLESGDLAAARHELEHHLDGAAASMIGSLGLQD